jgi:hypothetical protein
LGQKCIESETILGREGHLKRAKLLFERGNSVEHGGSILEQYACPKGRLAGRHPRRIPEARRGQFTQLGRQKTGQRGCG